jgi:drug/metabolite transporter (DMT)-like permease
MKNIFVSKETRSSILLFITAVIWGVAFVAQRNGMDYMGAFLFNGVRFLLGGAVLIPVTLFWEREAGQPENKIRLRTTYMAGALVGLVLFSAASLQQVGIMITMSASKAGFITGLYIVLTPILGIFIGKKTRIPTWLGTLLALGGLYLLSAPEGLGSVGWGDAALIACAFFWAIHILAVDHFAGRVYAIRLSIVQFMVCAALSMVCAFFTEPVTAQILWEGRVPILYSGLLSVGIAFTLQVVGQKHVAPAKAALIFSTESLFGAIGAAVLIHEILDGRSYVGCALIFAGILVSQIRFKNYL